MTYVARVALLLAALASWRGGSRRVAAALVITVVVSAISALNIPPRAALVCYLAAPAASAWLALHVATGRGWPVVSAWGGLATLIAVSTPPPRSLWNLAPASAHIVSVAVQSASTLRLRRPLCRESACVLVLLAGDIALALAMPLTSAAWWVAQAQTILVSAAIVCLHLRP